MSLDSSKKVGEKNYYLYSNKNFKTNPQDSGLLLIDRCIRYTGDCAKTDAYEFDMMTHAMAVGNLSN